MKRGEKLVVITKTYDLILWSCNHTSKFPRNHRFVLGERIERTLYDLLGPLIRASPQVGFSKVARILMVVVLPAPFGPINP